MSTRQPAVLALEDGSVFRGFAFGAPSTVVGEAVFNTSMTGYQEVLTDPSYFGQIVTMTAPQIGNYGINPEDEESDGPKVAAFVVRDLSPVTSNWRSSESLPDYLLRHGVPGLSGVDTRAITKKLRVQGAMNACLSTEGLSDAEAVDRARAWSGMVGKDFVKDVTCPAAYRWDPEGTQSQPFTVPGTRLPQPADRPRLPIVAVDLGAKRNILRRLHRHGLDVTVVPATASAAEILAHNPAGLFYSNGPGDPASLSYAHQTARELIGKLPIFGICLGHQVLTHALGADTFKLKFGHRGGNQPVKNLETGLVTITSQNHGFASSAEGIAARDAIVTEINLNDGTVEGMRHRDLPLITVQYHPEAAPGPNDSDSYFEIFYKMVAKGVQA